MSTRSDWPPSSFAGVLSPGERERFSHLGSIVEFPHRSFLLRQGDPDDIVYLLLDGYVKVTATSEDGVVAILEIRARGDLVGEYAALDGGVQPLSISAVNTVVARRISGESFRTHLEAYPNVRTTVFNKVISDMRAATERRVEARTWDARARIARVLHGLATFHGVPDEFGVSITLPLSQFELGALAACSEATAERTLHELRKTGIIQTRYRRITVTDMTALRAIFKGNQSARSADLP